jgi:hypothetical protein
MNSPNFLEIGKEQFEKYYSRISKKYFFQYDYRHLDGELFSCVANDIEEARKKRNEWIDKRRVK